MKYIGIKFVDAEPMTAEVAEEKGYRVSNNKGDGYEITYEDGYKSWCPKDVFDKNNYTIKNEELAKTCEQMVSPDYKERFKAEYLQLKNRLNGLKRMLDAWDKGTLPFTPTCPRNVYDEQIKGMELYLNVLTVRAAMEHVTADYIESCPMGIAD
jgi:hypothetical protein